MAQAGAQGGSLITGPVRSGPARAVQTLIDWAHSGPPMARVGVKNALDVAEVLEGIEQRETM